jgi:hypothetical protein
MTCEICIKHNKSNGMTSENRNFRTSTLTRHAESHDHKAAVQASNMMPEFNKAIKKLQTEKQNDLYRMQ